MSERSKKLQRQIRKTFGVEDLETDVAAIAAALPPEKAALLAAFPQFLDAVEDAYEQNDKMLNVVQTNLELGSAELSQANKRLFALNQTFDAMMNSLEDGFLLFDINGFCQDIYSKACGTVLETDPKGKAIAEVLQIPQKDRVAFESWCKLMFQETFDFEELILLGPKRFPHSRGREILLDFKPVRDDHGKILFVLLIATDRTEEITAKEKADRMYNFANMVMRVVRNRAQFKKLQRDVEAQAAELQQIVRNGKGERAEWTRARQIAHTIKGSVSMFYLEALREQCHIYETKILDLVEARDFLQLTSVFVDRIREEMACANEDLQDLISSREVGSRGPVREVPVHKLWRFASEMKGRSNSEEYLQFLEAFLYVDISDLFEPFQGTVQDLALRLGKRVQPIEFVNGNIRILPEPYDEVLSAFVHVIRNVLDHGIEAPEVRTSKGKEPHGRITISFRREKNGDKDFIEIRVIDDGKGLDTAKLRERLRAKGLLREGMAEFDIWNSIFDSGMSTAEKITEISGRGEGLAALRYAVQQMGGRIFVEKSETDKGCTFCIALPWISEINLAM
jgi:two-component system, chemotaxis family, sensor kinase CheA